MSMKNNEDVQRQEIDVREFPNLTEEELEYAESVNQLEFMEEFCHESSVGKYHWFNSMGFSLQYAGNGEFRCIYAVDHPGLNYCLALVNHTVMCVGGHIVFSPYTVLVPYVERSVDNESQSEVKPVYGMEVA